MNTTLEAKGIKGDILLVPGSSLVSLCVLEIVLRFLTPFPIHGHTNLQPHNLLGYTRSSRLSDVDHNGFRNPPRINIKILITLRKSDFDPFAQSVMGRFGWKNTISAINRHLNTGINFAR